MYKKIFGKKLSRNTSSRKALFRSLIFSLVKNGKIETTKTKAKAIQADVDKLMTLVSKDTLAAKKLAMSRLANNTETVNKLFGELKELVTKRKSGFTRITNLPNRHGDNSPMARIEWVDILEKKEKKKTKK